MVQLGCSYRRRYRLAVIGENAKWMGLWWVSSSDRFLRRAVARPEAIQAIPRLEEGYAGPLGYEQVNELKWIRYMCLPQTSLPGWICNPANMFGR